MLRAHEFLYFQIKKAKLSEKWMKIRTHRNRYLKKGTHVRIQVVLRSESEMSHRRNNTLATNRDGITRQFQMSQAVYSDDSECLTTRIRVTSKQKGTNNVISSSRTSSSLSRRPCQPWRLRKELSGPLLSPR